MNNGAEDRPNSHLHPSVGATAKASATSKQAPSAQKHCKFNCFHLSIRFYEQLNIIKLTSKRTTHFARCFVGKNSAYSVTLLKR